MPWRWPTLLFLIALAGLAVQPQIFLAGRSIYYETGIQDALIGLALIANGLAYGVRRTVNWPILALVVVLALNLTVGKVHPGLTLGFMLVSLFILALPWSFTQVVMAPEARRAAVLVIALAPLLSLAVAGVLQTAGLLRPHSFRLRGAAGGATVFAALAFAAFAVTLHEATRRGRLWPAALAVGNCALVFLSGTRMAIFASFVFAAAYASWSVEFRQRLRAHPVLVALAVCILTGVVLWYFPTFLRLRVLQRGEFRWSLRDVLWASYFEEFRASPLFGWGIGAGFVGRALPHNEYLHLLVIGGGVGFALCIAAIGLWLRQVLSVVQPADRAFLAAAIPAVAVYWLTDNLLVYSTALALYAYIGLLLPEPGTPARRRI